MVRKTLWMALLTLCASSAGAQIADGTRWWDGEVLYQAHANGRYIDFEGYDEFGSTFGHFFRLLPVDGEADEYVLLGKDIEDLPLNPRCEPTTRVRSVRCGNGQNCLAVLRTLNSDVNFILTQTVDEIDALVAREKQLEDMPFGQVCSTTPLNVRYLSRYPKAALRLLRNEIPARHGYRFRAADLQAHFSRQPWYKPGADNEAIVLSTVENLNLQLIRSEEQAPDYLREAPDVDQSYYVGGNDRNEYRVNCVEEFIANLGSDRTLIVPAGQTFNLSEVLDNDREYAFVVALLRAAKADGEPGTVFREQLADGGHRLVLKNFRNLEIRGSGGAAIRVNDAQVAAIKVDGNCHRVEFHNLTVGPADNRQ